MRIKEYIKDKRKKKLEKKLPLIARVDLVALQKEREKNMELGEVSILARADYTKKLPTIRLYYVAFEKYNAYDSGLAKIGQTFGISSPFRIPRNMSIEDACKVVSYLSDKVEKENNLEPASEKSVIAVSKLLSNYGFDIVYTEEKGHFHTVSEFSPFHKIKTDSLKASEKIDGVVDLFTIGGNAKLFKKTDLNSRYFNWYTKGVTKTEVEEIYKNNRIEHLLPDAYSIKSL